MNAHSGDDLNGRLSHHAKSLLLLLPLLLLCAAILDELAFWRSEESVNPDEEVVNAILPSLATTPGSMLIGLSSPHRKAGILYNRHKNYWAVPGAIRIIKGPTPLMNSTVPPEVIAEAVERDAAVARAEWFAEFRDDVGAAFDPDLIDQATQQHDNRQANMKNNNGFDGVSWLRLRDVLFQNQ